MDDASARHQRLCELFAEWTPLSEDSRRQALAELAKDDAELARKLGHMLRIDQDPPAWLAANFGQVSMVAGEEDFEVVPSGSRFGPFRILDQLGSGGHGVVYTAEQDEPRRLVALKLLSRRNAGDPAAERRFESEAALLGSLAHPGLCRVHAAGRSEGRRWIAMELVRGTPLTRGLASASEEVVLDRFEDLAAAVSFAHGRGVLHRDLKPGNVLLTEEGTVKVLDFGIARLLPTHEQEGAGLATESGMVLGTLAYMSPEQATQTSDTLDVRSDVFAIGAMLYEVLTGNRLRDLDSLAPSAAMALVSNPPVGKLIAELRGCSPDLRTILGTALAVDRSRRYPTVDAFAEDLRRMRRNEPIRARPPTAGYVLGRFARRHRGLVGAAAVAFIGLAVGLVLALGSAADARVAKTRAEHATARAQEEAEFAAKARDVAREATAAAKLEAATASEVVEFVEAAFQHLDPFVSQGHDPSMLEGLEAIARQLKQAPPSDVRVRGRLSRLLGNLMIAIGQAKRAVAWLESARSELSPDTEPIVWWSTSHALASAHLSNGEVQAAHAIVLASEQVMERLGPIRVARHHSLYASVLVKLGYVEEALDIAQQAVKIGLRQPGASELARANLLRSLGFALRAAGQFESAIDAASRAIELLSAPDRETVHPFIGALMQDQAAAESARGNGGRALEIMQRVLTLTENAHGRAHPALGGVHMVLGALHEEQGDLAAAVKHFRLSSETFLESVGPGSARRYEVESARMRLARLQGRHHDALAMAEAAIENPLAKTKRHAGDAATAHAERARAMSALDPKCALEVWRTAVAEIAELGLPETSGVALDALAGVANALYTSGSFVEAGECFRKIADRDQPSKGDPIHYIHARMNAARAFGRGNRLEDAQAEIERAMAGFVEVRTPQARAAAGEVQRIAKLIARVAKIDPDALAGYSKLAEQLKPQQVDDATPATPPSDPTGEEPDGEEA